MAPTFSAAVTGGSGTATSVDNLWNALSTNLNNFLDTSMSIYGKFQIAEKMGVYLVWGIGYRRNASHLLHYCFLDTINFMVGILLSAGILFICFAHFHRPEICLLHGSAVVSTIYC